MNNHKSRILIVEDDSSILKGLKENLELENFIVAHESDGSQGLKTAKKEKPDLILLDVMLPSMSGFDICKNLRQDNINIPIIMLTGKSGEADKVLGLELGADDYVTKPFSIRELIARIKAILRRKNNIIAVSDVYKFGDVTVDFRKMEALKGKKPVHLSLKEFEIMKYFFAHEGEVVTRNDLLDNVWGYDVFPTTRTVDNYILMLRKKLENDHSVPKHLHTIPTAGYKFVK
ncbi:MAG: response regulator transcription factor [Ignavibacteria bacterium]|jgi:DNA-binding response OmpR family regulator|nr:response regulator transcription factor [Ignavibacteria bacterium]